MYQVAQKGVDSAVFSFYLNRHEMVPPAPVADDALQQARAVFGSSVRCCGRCLAELQLCQLADATEAPCLGDARKGRGEALRV